MIPQITTALAKGFNSKQILDYLIKKFPQYSGKIKDAMAAGFTIDQVLKFISGGKKALAKIDNQDAAEGLTEYQQMQNRNIGRREEVNKRALQGAALAATPIAVSAVSSALSRALPQTIQQLAPDVLPSIGSTILNPNMQPEQQEQGLPQVPSNQSSPQQPPANQVAASIPEPANIQQPEGISNPKEYLEKVGVLGDVDRMLKQKNTPEAIAATLGLKNIKGKVSGKIDPELLRNIEEYAKTAPIESQISEKLEQPSKELEKIQQEVERPKIEKNSVVSSPQGVGEVKEIRNGQAIVEVDGKLHKIKEDELIESPLPKKELADLHDDLLQGIEEETGEDVSRMVQWAGYNPETNTLKFLPHTGDLYTYDDISEEDAALLRDVLSVRKTSGSNFIGAWKKDSKSPIGAALSKLIRKLQSERGGKGNEYSQKHGTIYSAYEPAIEAKKRKRSKK